jgi:flavin reductase (DIM6/NTAB) family NADH-FMN oxidoreductase RutF
MSRRAELAFAEIWIYTPGMSELTPIEYLPIPAKRAYSLLNCGGLILVCTKSPSGRYDLAPIAWACPLDYEPVSRLLFISDPGHESFANIEATGRFAVALPSKSQKDLVKKTGSVSGRKADKYEKFGIRAFPGIKVDVLIPEGVAAWLECALIRTVAEGSVSIVMGEVLAARAVGDAWRERLHYVSEKVYYAPGEAL